MKKTWYNAIKILFLQLVVTVVAMDALHVEVDFDPSLGLFKSMVFVFVLSILSFSYGYFSKKGVRRTFIITSLAMLDSSVFILVVDILISGGYFNFILDKGGL